MSKIINETYLDISSSLLEFDKDNNVEEVNNNSLPLRNACEGYSIYNVSEAFKSLKLPPIDVCLTPIEIKTIDDFVTNQYQIMKNSDVALFIKNNFLNLITSTGTLYLVDLKLTRVINIILSSPQPRKIIYPNLKIFMSESSINDINGFQDISLIGSVYIDSSINSLTTLSSYIFDNFEFNSLESMLVNLLLAIPSMFELINKFSCLTLFRQENLISFLIAKNITSVDIDDYNNFHNSLKNQLSDINADILDKYNVDISSLDNNEIFDFLENVKCDLTLDSDIINSLSNYDPLIKRYLELKSKLDKIQYLDKSIQYSKYGSLLLRDNLIIDVISNRKVIIVSFDDLIFKAMLLQLKNKSIINTANNYKDYNHYIYSSFIKKPSALDKYIIEGVLECYFNGYNDVSEYLDYFEITKKTIVDEDSINEYLNYFLSNLVNLVNLNKTFIPKASNQNRISLINGSELYKYAKCTQSDLIKSIFIDLSRSFNDFTNINSNYKVNIEAVTENGFVISSCAKSLDYVIDTINRISMANLNKIYKGAKGKLNINIIDKVKKEEVVSI